MLPASGESIPYKRRSCNHQFEINDETGGGHGGHFQRLAEFLRPGDFGGGQARRGGSSTLTAGSAAFNTPPGDSKDILDDEAWEGTWTHDAPEDVEWYWYLLFFFLFIGLPVGLIVLLVVLLKKRKKRKLSK